MQNIKLWKPSKYVIVKGKLRASRDRKEVNIASRFITNLSAELFQTYIPKFVKGSLLDLGCGKAPLYQVYKPFTNKITCVDWNNSYHENKYTDIFADLNQSLPIENEQFDTIILSSVLEHLRDPNHILIEINRILKKEGIVLLSVPFYYHLHEVPHDYYRFTEHALQMLAKKHQFSILLLEPFGGLPEVLVDINSRLLIKIPVLGKLMVRLNHLIFQLILKTYLGKRFSKKTAHEFPLAYFAVLKKNGEKIKPY